MALMVTERVVLANEHTPSGTEDMQTAEVSSGVEEQASMLHVHSSSILQALPKPATLKFQDVGYRIKSKPKSPWWGNFNIDSKNESRATSQNASEKTILRGITGTVCPGEILAMLGPSGSGKTTLLNALGGRLRAGKVSGAVLINGRRFHKSMKRMIGFVTQDDVLYPHLTVGETLIYAALLRLPRALSKRDKVHQAESVITELGLTKCRNTNIGGISGGERKRVSIGHEMLLNPSLLLLDEPTSSLDSTTAYKIILTLHGLAMRGRTIVTTIHQPSSRLYHMFHKVILLSEGAPIYYGAASQAMDYFKSIGFSPSLAMNPADFMLDLANGITPDTNNETCALDEAEPQGKRAIEVQTSVKQFLVDEYNRNLAGKLREEINIDHTLDEKMHAKPQSCKWSTGWSQQFWILLKRSLKERRYESFGVLRIFQVLSASIFAGLIWWQSNVYRLQDQVGLLFFMTIFWGSLPVFNAIFTFPEELPMFIKERSSGMYRLSAYFFARTASDLPMELVLPTISVTITYWMTGLKSDGKAFILTLLVMLYNVMVSQGIGLALGAAVMDVKQSTTLATVTLLAFLLGGGYYIQHIPAFIRWLKYTSVPYYCYRLLLGVQYTKDQINECATRSCRISDLQRKNEDTRLGDAFLDVAAMGIMLVSYRFLSYAFLRRIKLAETA